MGIWISLDFLPHSQRRKINKNVVPVQHELMGGSENFPPVQDDFDIYECHSLKHLQKYKTACEYFVSMRNE